MKAFLQSILGVNALKAQIDLLKQDLEHMRAENERIQFKLSGLGKYSKLDLSRSQAAGILRIVDDFKARNCGGNICKH
jgi:hypothetical protein